MSITGFPDGPPAKVGVPITDISAGLLAANGILAAYIHTLKTGQGQMVDTSLLEAGIAYTIWESSGYFANGDVPGPLGSAHRVSAPYQALRTKDGYINLGAATQTTWEQFCRAVGLEALIDDARFRAPGDRKAREAELAALLEETLGQRDTRHWLETLGRRGWSPGRYTTWPRCTPTPTFKRGICWLTWKTRPWERCATSGCRSSCRKRRGRCGGGRRAWANTAGKCCWSSASTRQR